MKDHIKIHTKTMPDGRLIDVRKLQSAMSEAPIEKLPIDLIRGASRSKRSGFSLKRYLKADTRFPVMIDKDNFLIDGRHRYFKKLDKGHTQINTIRVSDAELLNHSMPTPVSMARKVKGLLLQRAARNVVELGYLGAGKPGFKRPYIRPYGKAAVKDESKSIIGGNLGGYARKHGYTHVVNGERIHVDGGPIVVYPNVGAAAERIKTNDYPEHANNPKKLSKSVFRHEMIHAIRDHNQGFAKSSIPRELIEEAATLKGELLGKRAKRLNGTPFRARLKEAVQSMIRSTPGILRGETLPDSL